MATPAGPTAAVPTDAAAPVEAAGAAVHTEPGAPAATAEPRGQRLFLIDGYSNIFRAFYAIRNLSNSRGEPTNAIYGFVTMLRKLLREEQPELIGVALETGKTFRAERFEAYKANRAPMPEDLASQMPWIRRVLEAFRIPILELAGYEADDVLGTLSCRAAEAGYHVVLVSADKDLMQLVEPRVSLYHTGRSKLYSPSDVAEDFGVPPAKVADVLALMGDSIDNIPGVPGIGDKGAKALIQEFGSLEKLLARAGEVARKSYREGLQQHAEQARLSKELSTIHTSLPIPFDPAALRLDPPDTAALRRLYGELEFFSLAEELAPEPAAQILLGAGAGAHPATAAGTEGAAGASVDAGPGAGLPVAREALSPAEWEAAAAEVLRAAAAGREGGGEEAGELFAAVLGEAPPLGLALAAGAGPAGPAVQAGEAAPVLLADFRRPGLREAAVATLGRWIAAPGARLAGHNLKEVLRLCPGGELCGAELFDAMLVSYLLKPSVHGHSLDELALERFNARPLSAKEAGWDKGQAPEPGDPRLLAYAAERVMLAQRMAAGMRQELAAGNGGALARIYRDLEMPLLPVLLGMEEAGIQLDAEYLRAMSDELGQEVRQLEEEIWRQAGERFNLNSPQQLGVVLFERLGLPALKRTQKTRSYSTGAETLEGLAARGYPIAQLLLRYRELSKLKSTYVDALPAMLGEDGRLHTRFYQAVAATGRLSSANPNLQNIPVRTELGQRIRRAFVAGPGQVLLVADYSQIELRILAHIAAEPELIRAFTAGEDIHRATAGTVFGVAPELVSADQRRAAKTINFGILYGMSAFGLSQNLGISKGDAERFIAAYLDRYRGVRRYVEETLQSAEREGKVETLYGRVRWLPDIRSKNHNLRENARRMAINARIQGTAADLLKQAMIAVDRRLRREHPGARLLLTVHDELLFEVPEAEVEPIGRLVRQEMEGVAQLAAPLVVDVGSGKSWYDAKT
ncbi:MAG TPA: DNA polymerase I [Thermoanaerobaculia bacterium]|nr:DNA polymerase I [Thermoanaerobaculia bacterium]